MKKTLILGAYGNFGRRIALGLARKNIPLILAGRNKEKLTALSKLITQTYSVHASIAYVDIHQNLRSFLSEKKPYVVINTCGPFQNNDYTAAKTCIDLKINYIDLADGRDYVVGINELDAQAKKNNCTVITGASTVPALSSAVINHFSDHFSGIKELRYGITPGQKTPRGLATTQAILSYTGKKIPQPGSRKTAYGWQGLYCQKYPELGRRLMANCDIPDLALFPSHYNIPKIKFSAGLENPIIHLSLWLLSWLVRVGTPIHLPRYAQFLLKMSDFFDRFGSADGGMHLCLKGLDHKKKPIKLTWFIVAKNGVGPDIPSIPAVVLAHKMMTDQFTLPGTHACIGLIDYETYLQELQNDSITTTTQWDTY